MAIVSISITITSLITGNVKTPPPKVKGHLTIHVQRHLSPLLSLDNYSPVDEGIFEPSLSRIT